MRAACTSGSRSRRPGLARARTRVGRRRMPRRRGGTPAPRGPRRCKLPAVWKSAEISASASQRRAGAICASSFRTSSASVTRRPPCAAACACSRRPSEPYPPSPSAPTTLWQGTTIPKRFVAQKEPAARAAPGCPESAASSPYVTVSPRPTPRRALDDRRLKRRAPRQIEFDVREVVFGDPRSRRQTGGERWPPDGLSPGRGSSLQRRTSSSTSTSPTPKLPASYRTRSRGTGSTYNRRVSVHAIFRPPAPFNEPVREYKAGSPERAELERRLQEMQSERMEIPCVIGGKDVRTGDTFESVMPHRKEHVLADVHQGGAAEVEQAIAAAAEAWSEWSRTPWEERVAVFIRASELLAGPWRATLTAATMLNQSKTVHQAEIDAACELIDFWRFNADYLVRIYSEQPTSSPRRLEPHGVPAAGGLRVRCQPLQLHGHRRQPDGVAGVDGQHGRVEAGVDVGLLRVLPHAPVARGGTTRRRDQPRLRARCRDWQPCAREPGPRRHPLHGLDIGVPGHVAHGRRLDRQLPQLPAHRRRDRRQRLHRRAPVRRPRGGGDGGAAWLVRVPGSEVLGRVAHLRPPVALGRDTRPHRGRGGDDPHGRRHRLPELHGCGDRRQSLRRSTGRRSRRRSPRGGRSSPAAPPTTARASSSSRR